MTTMYSYATSTSAFPAYKGETCDSAVTWRVIAQLAVMAVVLNCIVSLEVNSGKRVGGSKVNLFVITGHSSKDWR